MSLRSYLSEAREAAYIENLMRMIRTFPDDESYKKKLKDALEAMKERNNKLLSND